LIKIKICDKRSGAPNFEIMYYFPITNLTPLDLRLTPQGAPSPSVETAAERFCCFISVSFQLCRHYYTSMNRFGKMEQDGRIGLDMRSRQHNGQNMEKTPTCVEKVYCAAKTATVRHTQHYGRLPDGPLDPSCRPL